MFMLTYFCFLSSMKTIAEHKKDRQLKEDSDVEFYLESLTTARRRDAALMDIILTVSRCLTPPRVRLTEAIG